MPELQGKGWHWYMGEVVPGECMTNALYEDNHVSTLSSSDQSWVRLAWEEMLELHAVGHAMGASAPVAEPMREDEEEEGEGEGVEEDRRRGSSSTDNLALGRAPVLQWAMPASPKFWATGPSIQVARQGPPTCLRAQGKAHTVQVAPLPPDVDEELVQWLQEKEVVVEKAQLGRNTATLEVVIETAGPLLWGQV